MADDGYTRCPGCGLRVFPGQGVTGVEHEDPWKCLWHTVCLLQNEREQRDTEVAKR